MLEFCEEKDRGWMRVAECALTGEEGLFEVALPNICLPLVKEHLRQAPQRGGVVWVILGPMEPLAHLQTLLKV